MSKKSRNPDSYGFVLAATGLLAGFFLGAVVVYWYTNRYDGNILPNRFIEKASRTIDHIRETEVEKLNSEASRPAGHDASEQQQRMTPTANLDGPGSTTPGNLNTTDIQVSRDRLIGIREISLSHYTEPESEPDSSRRLDSLIGSRGRESARGMKFYIEFRESPLNYSVYKMEGNRAVVYGISKINMVRLIQHNRHLYLNYDDQYYRLIQTTEYRQLQPESDVDVINELDNIWQ